MKNVDEIVNRELSHSFYTSGKRNEYNATRVAELTKTVTQLLGLNAGFRNVWVEVFFVYPQHEALRCVQRIYKELKLNIPADLRPVDDSL